MSRPCPKCEQPLPKGVRECPSCGVKLKVKRVVRKKSALPSLDDSQVTEAQQAQLAEVRRREDEAARQAEEEKRRELEEKKRRALTQKRRREEQERKQAEEAARNAEEEARRQREEAERLKLGQERLKLQAERESLVLEKKRMEEEWELEQQRRKLEEERRKLEEERRQLEQEASATRPAPSSDGDAKRKALEKKKAQALARRKARTAAEILELDDDDDEIEAEEDEDDLPAMDPREFDDLAAASRSKPRTAVKQQVKPRSGKAVAQKKKPASVKTAAQAPEPDAFREMKPETVGDWVDDFKGINWKKIGIRYGTPVGLLFVMLLYIGPAIVYSVTELKSIAAIPATGLVPQGKSPVGIPGAEPQADEVWLPLGPVRLKVPKAGPIAISWERKGSSSVKVDEAVTLYFPGFMLRAERYQKAAVLKALAQDPKFPTALIDEYAGKTPDMTMLDHVMKTTPSDFSVFSGPSYVKRFRAMMRLKVDLFPEIKDGLTPANFGATAGYFFGKIGPDPQRIEVFDTLGRRFSYYLYPSGPFRKQLIFKYAQDSQPPHYRIAQTELDGMLNKLDGSEDPFATLKAGMWAAGCALGETATSKVDVVRSMVTSSLDLNNLAGQDKARAISSFSKLQAENDKRLKYWVRELLRHPYKSVRQRMQNYASTMSGRNIQKGLSGYTAFSDWVAAQERKEK